MAKAIQIPRPIKPDGDNPVEVRRALQAAYKRFLVTPAMVTTDQAGDPTGTPLEGTFCINSADKTLKVYADGAWRAITSW